MHLRHRASKKGERYQVVLGWGRMINSKQASSMHYALTFHHLCISPDLVDFEVAVCLSAASRLWKEKVGLLTDLSRLIQPSEVKD